MNLTAGLAWLGSAMASSEGVTVVYARGATELSITAVPGRSNWEREEADGAIVHADTVDWFIAKADLGALDEPADGDTITYDGRVFTLMSPSSENPWRWCDGANRSRYRVHTRQTGTG